MSRGRSAWPYELEPGLLAMALDIARSVPDGESRRRPGAAFAPRVAVTGGGLLDQIVALLGRRPGWPRLSAPAPGPAATVRRPRTGRVTVEPWALTGWMR